MIKYAAALVVLVLFASECDVSPQSSEEQWINAAGGSYLTALQGDNFFKHISTSIYPNTIVTIQNNGSFRIPADGGDIVFALYDKDGASSEAALYKYTAGGRVYYSYLGRNMHTGYIYIYNYSETPEGATTNAAPNQLLIRR